MKRNHLTTLFSFGVILSTLFLLAANRPEVKSLPAAATAANHTPAVIDPADIKFYYASEAAANHTPAVIDPADRKFFYTTETSPAAHANGGIAYAMDPVELKLFNASGSSPAAAKAGIVYAMDPVDLKLFSVTNLLPVAAAR